MRCDRRGGIIRVLHPAREWELGEGSEYIPILRRLVAAVALFATPISVHVLRHLLVTAVRGARSVVEVVLLDVYDGGAYVEVVGLFRHAEIFVLDLGDGPAFGHVTTHATGDSASADGSIGVRFEFGVSTVVVEPAAQHVRLGDVRVDEHGGAREHAEAPSAKVADLDTLERDHGLLINAGVVGEGLGVLSPEREPDAAA